MITRIVGYLIDKKLISQIRRLNLCNQQLIGWICSDRRNHVIEG